MKRHYKIGEYCSKHHANTPSSHKKSSCLPQWSWHPSSNHHYMAVGVHSCQVAMSHRMLRTGAISNCISRRIQIAPRSPQPRTLHFLTTKNKMEATNPNVCTFLDYERKPLQQENEPFFHASCAHIVSAKAPDQQFTKRYN